MDCKAVVQAAKDDIEKLLGGVSTGWSEILQKAATDLESHCPAWQPLVGSLAAKENTKLVLQLVNSPHYPTLAAESSALPDALAVVKNVQKDGGPAVVVPDILKHADTVVKLGRDALVVTNVLFRVKI